MVYPLAATIVDHLELKQLISLLPTVYCIICLNAKQIFLEHLWCHHNWRLLKQAYFKYEKEGQDLLIKNLHNNVGPSPPFNTDVSVQTFPVLFSYGKLKLVV